MSKRNPILENMKSKVEQLKSTIEMCDKLLKGEKIQITFMGNPSYDISMKEGTEEKTKKVKWELINEMLDLEKRISYY